MFGQALRVIHTLNPLGHAFGGRAKKVGVIHFLERFAIPCIAGYITDKQHHGRGVLKSCMHANGSVGRPRSTGHKTNTRSTAEFALRFCHKSGTSLLPTRDKLNLIPVQMETVQHRQVAFTRHAKRVSNALGKEAFN